MLTGYEEVEDAAEAAADQSGTLAREPRDPRVGS
jgi:hypothetical protein